MARALNLRGIAALGLAGLLAAGLGLAPPRQAAVGAKDSKERWFTIYIDAGWFVQPSQAALDDVPWPSAPTAYPPQLAVCCNLPQVWLPLTIDSPWSTLDQQGVQLLSGPGSTGVSGQASGVEPFPVRAGPGARNHPQWFRGKDRVGPDGASQWSHLILGPPCEDCCDASQGWTPEAKRAIERGIMLDFHVRSSRPRIDTNALAATPWTPVPSELASFLKPQPYVQSDDAAVVAFARHWAATVQSKSPWATALAIATGAAARAAQEVVVGEYAQRSSRTGASGGLAVEATRGLKVQGAAAYAASGQGNVNDAHCLSVAAMRAAGIPARVILGWEVVDVPNGFSDPTRLVTWGEFWIQGAGWLPFDCGEMRVQARGNPSPGRPIDGFGSPELQAQRIAWTCWFDAPFEFAQPRERPAGYSIGIVYTSAEHAKAAFEREVKDGLRVVPPTGKPVATVGAALEIMARSGLVAGTSRETGQLGPIMPGVSKQ